MSSADATEHGLTPSGCSAMTIRSAGSPIRASRSVSCLFQQTTRTIASMSQLEIATHTDAGETPGRAGWILALGSVAAFAVFLDTTIVNVAFETISRSFGTTTGHLSWALNSYSLVFAAVLIPSGRLADRYGRKRLFLTGLAGFAVFSALCGAAPDPGVLIAARALQGACAA